MDFEQAESVVLTGQVVNSIFESAICCGAEMLIALFLLASLALPLRAGTLSGNVKASRGESVIYLAPVRPLHFTPKSQTYVIHQKGMRFTPTLLVVPQGASVEFPTEDLAPHNVYWKS